jgi:CMP-N-acetylneuraminic acid synthetase
MKGHIISDWVFNLYPGEEPDWLFEKYFFKYYNYCTSCMKIQFEPVKYFDESENGDFTVNINGINSHEEFCQNLNKLYQETGF